MNTWMQVAMAASPGGGGHAAAGGQAGPMAGLTSLLPLILIFVLFYLLFIVPQRKQQKQHQELLKSLKKGDEVLTSSGIFGSILGFNEKDNTVYLKVAENVKIEVQRSAVSGLRRSPGPAKPEGS